MLSLFKGVLLSLVLLFMSTATIFATEKSSVFFTLDGEMERGNYLTLQIKVKNVQNLYAASLDWEYDPSVLEVISLSSGAMFDNQESVLELGENTAKDRNRATYQMTFMGKESGISGSGTLLEIEFKVLQNQTLTIDNESMVIKLAQVDDNYEISNLDYAFEIFQSESKQSAPSVQTVVGGSGESNNLKNPNLSIEDSELSTTDNPSKSDPSNEEKQNEKEVMTGDVVTDLDSTMIPDNQESLDDNDNQEMLTIYQEMINSESYQVQWIGSGWKLVAVILMLGLSAVGYIKFKK